MNNQNQDRANDNTSESLNPSVNTGNGHTNTGIHGANNRPSPRHNPRSKPSIHKKFIAFVTKDGKQPAVANLISLFMLLVTAFLALYTYKVFRQTTRQTEIADSSAKASKISADAAKLSADLQKQAFDRDEKIRRRADSIEKITARKADSAERSKSKRDNDLFDLQKKTFANNEKDINERFKRDTQAINLQIKSLKQNQDQFTKQNEPYLKINIDSIYVKFKQLYFGYTIFNLTNTPVRITGEKSEVQIFGFEPLVPNPLTNTLDGVLYITKESPQPKYATVKNATPDQIAWVNSGTYSLYWIAIFEYENEVTGEKRHYRIKVKITKVRGENPPHPLFYENINESK